MKKTTPTRCTLPECPLDHCACGIHSDEIEAGHACSADAYASMTLEEIEIAEAVAAAERLAGWDPRP